jgi:Flp pilus assembly protein TadD
MSGTDGTAGKLDRAIVLHQQGELESAELLYREILQAQPRHFDALHFLGIAAGQRGQGLAAVDLLIRMMRPLTQTLAMPSWRSGATQTL